VLTAGTIQLFNQLRENPVIPQCNDDGYLPAGFIPMTFRNRPKPGSQGNVGGLLMSIENRRQLENTRAKLRELEQLITKTEQTTKDHLRDLTLLLLKQRLNQFKEEIARFEARACQASSDG
jgi:hypothetical protein